DGQVSLLGASDPQCLEHSVARFDLLASPDEWLHRRTCLGETQFRFGAVEDTSGQVHAAFSNLAGELLYFRYAPSTQRWSSPRSVTGVPVKQWAMNVSITIGATGRIHVVWSEFEPPRFYPPLGVYYAGSSDGGITWSKPLELAGQGNTEPAIVAVGSDTV